MDLVFLEGRTVDQDVVKLGGAEVVEEGAEDIVDEVLEVGRSVGKSKGHDQGFEETVSCPDCSRPLFPLSHPNHVVGASNIQGSIIFCLGEAIQCVSDQGQGVAILNGSLIEATIVDTEA